MLKILFSSLIRETSFTPADPEAIELFQHYERQRERFLDKRISEVKNSYTITENEERVLLGYFNTEERNSVNDNNEVNITFKIMRVFKHHKDEDELFGNEAGYSAALGWLRIYWSKAWLQFCFDYKYTLSARFALIHVKDKNLSDNIFPLASRCRENGNEV